MENNIVIKKVPVEILLEVLDKLYSLGVDYVDITGDKGENQDKIAVSFTEDYLSEESPLKNRNEEKDEQEDVQPLPPLTINLTDDDLNHLS